jgi:RNA polymerase sigma-70 factor (ECF subfamily)
MSDLASIIAEHSEAVWRTVYRLLNHHDDALDCYQETFLAALHLEGRDEIRHWRTLLVRIATRRAIDRLRQRYQNEKRSRQSEFLDCRPAPDAPPEASAEGDELRDAVRQALAKLPPEQAEAFWLRHLEHLSVGEVAQLMTVEPGHARVLVHRAALRLREALGPSFGFTPISEQSP